MCSVISTVYQIVVRTERQLGKTTLHEEERIYVIKNDLRAFNLIFQLCIFTDVTYINATTAHKFPIDELH